MFILSTICSSYRGGGKFYYGRKQVWPVLLGHEMGVPRKIHKSSASYKTKALITKFVPSIHVPYHTKALQLETNSKILALMGADLRR